MVVAVIAIGGGAYVARDWRGWGVTRVAMPPDSVSPSAPPPVPAVVVPANAPPIDTASQPIAQSAESQTAEALQVAVRSVASMERLQQLAHPEQAGRIGDVPARVGSRLPVGVIELITGPAMAEGEPARFVNKQQYIFPVFRGDSLISSITIAAGEDGKLAVRERGDSPVVGLLMRAATNCEPARCYAVKERSQIAFLGRTPISDPNFLKGFEINGRGSEGQLRTFELTAITDQPRYRLRAGDKATMQQALANARLVPP